MVRHLPLLCVGAQTGCREKAPAAVGVCAPFPGKPYSSVEGRKPFTRKSPRRLREFAPPSRESLILPLRGANQLPGKAPAAVRVCASLPGKPYFSVERRKPFTRKSSRRRCEFAPPSRESLILPLRGANPSPGNPPGASASLRPPLPGKPYSSVEGGKPFTRKSPGGCESLRLPPGKALFFR